MSIELKPDGTYAMTETEKKSILESMEKEYENSLNITQDIRLRWWLVERYIEGNQWGAAESGNRTFLSVANNSVMNNSFEVDVDENIVVDNIMLRIHMTNMARLSRYKPQIEISPNQKSNENTVAVRKGRIACYDLLQKSNWIRLQQTHARHLNIMGLTFLKVVYDPSAGKMVKWPRFDALTGEVAVDVNGKPLFDSKPEGEVRLLGANPKNMQFPANCTSELDADWIQETNVRSTSYVKRAYKVVVKPEAISAFDQGRAGVRKSGPEGNEDGKDQDSVLVKERWYRPCEKYPNGAIIVWVKGQLLVCKSLDKWYPDLPYFAARNVFNDESVYADSVAYHLIQHQNEVNRTESNIARHVNLVGKPKLLVHKDGRISDKAFTTDTGEIVEYSGDKAPVWLNAPPVSPALYEHVERHVGRMMMIGYANDIARPGHARSGNAIAYEQEIDENTMAPMVASVTDMLERGLSFGLRLMARYYKIPRMIKMLDSNAWTIENEFKGDDLFGNFDVRVNFLAGLPANKLASNQFVVQMYEKGLLDKPLAQKYLELGDAQDALREQALEFEVAENVVKKMSQGYLVPFHEWDNHPLLILSIERWLKQNGDEVEEGIVQNFEEALKMHKEYMAIQSHPANAVVGAPDGMPPPEGGAPPEGGDIGPGLNAGIEPQEMGDATSGQEAGQQPAPEQVLQSGPPGV